MTYNKLKSILKNNSEVHYLTDCDIFLEDNNLNISDFKNNEFILFEYTTQMITTIKLLKENNIKYSIHEDELDLQYIII